MKKIFRTMLCVLCTLTLLLSLTAPAVASAEESENTVYIAVKDYGLITVVLNPEEAPITVANFKKLVGEGFYDGLTFHRIVPGFVIQGGDPTGTGMGGPGWHITGEFASNGIRNDLKHTRGVLSWARSMDPNSAGSQFFIMVDDAPHLDGDYAAFGKVTEGIDLVDAIVKGMYGRKPVMKTVSIDE